MPQKKLSSLLNCLKQVYNAKGAVKNSINNINYDSRAITPGSLFVAMEGLHLDGHNYITKAIQQGASAIIHSKNLEVYHPDVAYIQLENPSQAMSSLANSLYQEPWKNLKTIGITGTNGKSSTVWFIHQWLQFLGKKSGFISTVEYQTDEEVIKNHYRQSTPESSEIHRMMHQMVRNQKEYAVIEATSHGLSRRTNRLADVFFDAVLFTNLTHEHLEFHKSFDNYKSDKANLFRQIKPLSRTAFGVVNSDDPVADYFIASTDKPVYSFSLTDKTATAFAEVRSSDLQGSHFILYFKDKSYSINTELTGIFNIQNIMASFLIVQGLTQLPPEEILVQLPRIQPVLGRMMPVKQGQPFYCLIDYAHSPGSFKSLLPGIRRQTTGRLIMVFGSAGERDIEKRKIQGELASRYADIIILTNEDPREEDEMKIIRDIAEGCSLFSQDENLFLIPDRQEAINKAVSLAQKNDCVLCLGKSHESSIIKAEGPTPWDEKQALIKALKTSGYSNSL